MNLYIAAKYVHVGCVVLSICGFILRGVWMMTASDMLQRRATKLLPHVVDSFLLGAALVMVFTNAAYPFAQSWLTAKLIALVIYILLGTVALKRGRTRRIRIIAWLSAIAVYAYMVAVALTRSPLALLAIT